MTPLEQQMIDELIVAQGFTNNLAANLNTKGVPSNTNEGLDTLVPKVLQIDSGDAKTPYEEWQEGFGYNWDNVVANAPMTNSQRILHVYTKVELLRMASTFPTTVEIYTFNGSVYRQITMDVDKRLAFINDDYINNSFDSLQYVCVVYGNNSWGNSYFNKNLPVVYANSKSANDYVNNLINLGKYIFPSIYPFLRGLDINILDGTTNNPFCIGESLEHLTVQNYSPIITLYRLYGKEAQVRILKYIVDSAPSVILDTAEYLAVSISDENLANWFYNDFFYNRFVGNTFIYALQPTNIVRQFNIRPDIQFYGQQYLYNMPNMIYLNGFISEDVTNTTYAGCHGFNNRGWVMLQNFPMWKVLEGATTGCLLPMVSQTNVSLYTNGSFLFYSTLLNPKYFCEFDENGIIEDPTKYFLCNLPVQNISHANIYVRFMDLTFKDNYTESQQDAIRTYLANKNWNLVW